jgi:hypothetical protein
VKKVAEILWIPVALGFAGVLAVVYAVLGALVLFGIVCWIFLPPLLVIWAIGDGGIGWIVLFSVVLLIAWGSLAIMDSL